MTYQYFVKGKAHKLAQVRIALLKKKIPCNVGFGKIHVKLNNLGELSVLQEICKEHGCKYEPI